MESTDNLGLPFIVAAQAQKHVTHNESLRTLDALVQLAVRDKDLGAPPAGPAAGDRYIVASEAAGAWSGQAGMVAAWQDGAWAFHVPREGWLAWVADEQRLYCRQAGAWAPVNNAFDSGSAIVDGSGNALLGFQAAASAANHIAVASAAAGSGPAIAAAGEDANIDLNLTPKGTGTVRSNAQLAVRSQIFPPIRIERTTVGINTVASAQQLLSTSSGDMDDGFGVNLNFAIRDDNSVINEIGNFVFSRAGADNSGRFQLQPYSSGIPSTRFEIGPGGNVYFPGVGTTAGAANAVLNNSSSPSNELLRSTSSLRYKTAIEDVRSDWREAIQLLRPMTYRSTANADDPNLRWYGLIAEEVSEVEPLLVSRARTADGSDIPEAVQYERLTVLLLKAVQELLKNQESREM